MSKRFLLLLLSIIMVNILYSQSVYEGGVMPKLNFNGSINKLWNINVKAESKMILSQGTFSGPGNNGFEHNRTEIAIAGERATSYNTSLAAGYLLRLHAQKPVHRFFQQYSWIKQFGALTLGHRLSTDQTFKTGAANEYRLRYRLSTALPLSGEQIDRDETYLKVSNEYLGSWENQAYGLEIRFLAAAGRDMGGDEKVEAGLAYRAGSVFQQTSAHEFWLYMAWYTGF